MSIRESGIRVSMADQSSGLYRAPDKVRKDLADHVVPHPPPLILDVTSCSLPLGCSIRSERRKCSVVPIYPRTQESCLEFASNERRK
jgi:hypothetical protein